MRCFPFLFCVFSKIGKETYVLVVILGGQHVNVFLFIAIRDIHGFLIATCFRNVFDRFDRQSDFLGLRRVGSADEN